MLFSDEYHRAVQAAEGWLGLGCPDEAEKELAGIPDSLQRHPEVLKVRWEALAAAKKWEAAAAVAAESISVSPGSPHGWIQQSYALHELRRTTEARDKLQLVVEKFSDLGLIRYNLACYECQLGDLEAAKKWLRDAMMLGDRRQVIKTALQDGDLEPLKGYLALL